MERAVTDLQLLEIRRQAAEGLRAQIAMVEADILSLSGVSYSKTPIRGGGNQQEQRLCAYIDRKSGLEAKEKAMHKLVRHTERVLNSLGEPKRTVLVTFYCRGLRPGEAVRRLEGELHMAQASIYRIRERGLWEFACQMGYT